MCDNPTKCFLVRHPKKWFGNFTVYTKNYHEVVQYNKDYILFPSDKNFKLAQKFEHFQFVWLPCGKCIQCLHSRAQSWTIRSSLELQKYKQACCLTLTYREKDLPENAVLRYKDVQDFIKRLRWHLKKHTGQNPNIKYLCACEYGKKHLRPHYHIVIFGYFPPDVPFYGGKLRPYKITSKGSQLFKSKFINNLWSKGFVDVGLVNHQTCRYVAQYCCKKFVTQGDKRLQEKNKISREKLVCSSGFGLDWFKRNYLSVIASDKIVFGGFTFAIPRYFIKKLEQINETLYKEVKERRYLHFLTYVFDEEKKRESLARSARLEGRLKLFHSKNDGDKFLVDFLHNIYYNYIPFRMNNGSKSAKLQNTSLEFHFSDARQSVLALQDKYDFIFLDAFTPKKLPTLWSYEFFKELYRLLDSSGVLVTYSSSAAIRGAMLEAGFFVGTSLDENGKTIGTIAAKKKELIKHDLSEFDLGLIKTRAGIFYRDENLNASADVLTARRELEVQNSSRITSSRYKKEYAKKL